MRCPREWEVYRRESPHAAGEMGDACNGFLVVPQAGLVVVFSNGEGWEHVSASFGHRCPTWEEMDAIKRRFWQPDDVVIQIHPAESDHVNCHPYCLHLWRPTEATLPTPPKWMVA